MNAITFCISIAAICVVGFMAMRREYINNRKLFENTLCRGMIVRVIIDSTCNGVSRKCTIGAIVIEVNRHDNTVRTTAGIFTLKQLLS